MDLNYSPEETAFRDEVRGWLRTSLPDALRDKVLNYRELSKDDLAPLLEARPQISEELCRTLARRQAAGQLMGGLNVDKSEPANRAAGWFAERLHRMFDFTAAH